MELVVRHVHNTVWDCVPLKLSMDLMSDSASGSITAQDNIIIFLLHLSICFNDCLHLPILCIFSTYQLYSPSYLNTFLFETLLETLFHLRLREIHQPLPIVSLSTYFMVVEISFKCQLVIVIDLSS